MMLLTAPIPVTPNSGCHPRRPRRARAQAWAWVRVWPLAAALLLVLLGLTDAGAVAGQAIQGGVSISADDETPYVGQEITITWRIYGDAVQVRVQRDGTTISRASQGSTTFTPQSTTPVVFRILGTSRYLGSSYEHQVTIRPEPLAASIAADDAAPSMGEAVTVTWSSANDAAVSVTRDGTVISDANPGSITFTPKSRQPVVFQITATVGAASATRQVTVSPRGFSTLAGMVGITAGGPWVAQLLIMLVAAGVPAFVGRFRLPALGLSVIVMPLAAFATAALGIGSYWLVTIVIIIIALAGVTWGVAARRR